MDAADFYEFMFYERMEPFGDRRLDLLVGQICALIANVNRSKDTKAYKPADFMIPWDQKPAERQSPSQMLAMMKILQAAQNAKVAQMEGQGSA